MHQKIEQQQALYKGYNAVPPPPFLYADPHRVNSKLSPIHDSNMNHRSRLNPNFGPNPNVNPNPNPSPSDGDSEKKSRRRRMRRAQEAPAEVIDVVSSSGSNGTKEGSAIRRAESLPLSETLECTSSLRSPSPNSMPSPSFSSKLCEASNASEMGTPCEPIDGLARPMGSICTPNKARCRDIPISKPKNKDINKVPLICNTDPKPDKVKYSPKVKTDMACASKSGQDCNCSGIPRFLPEETSTSSPYQVRGDEQGSSKPKQFYEASPSKGRCNQRAKSEKSPGCFQPHWPVVKTEKALEVGQAFRCKVRVNAYCRTEAYASIDGLPVDVLIDGIQAQNRAIEGDIVAVVVNPVSMWVKLKGSVAKPNSPGAKTDLEDILVCGNASPSTAVCLGFEETQSDCVEHGTEATSVGKSGYATTQANVPGITRENMNDTGEVFSNSVAWSNVSDDHRGVRPMEASLSNCASKNFQELLSLVSSLPDKRPTGEVVAILEKSDRRQSVVGLLEVQRQKCRNEPSKKHSQDDSSTLNLVPSDSRFPKMMVSVNSLPNNLKERYLAWDATLNSELVAACVKDWRPDCSTPYAEIIHSLGQGGEIDAHMAAILFEQAVHSAEFPLSTLKCLPKVPWKIPIEEFEKRRNLTGCRIFTIDPPTAKDLDDALSIERLEDGCRRIGVHIADVSYFVHPETELDKEAQLRSTSVYLIQRVLPMLPRLLCEELCSLNPGVDRLALSIMWDIDHSGQIVNHWIGRTIINSCCKLSYNHAQDVIDGKVIVNTDGTLENGTSDVIFPELYRDFKWGDVLEDIRAIHYIAKCRRDARFEAGALRLQNSRLVFDLDEDGIPNSSSLYEQQDANFLVEEFMLLANMTAAKFIATAFPDCALLRRHPEPNIRKMKDLEDFCNKNGLKLNTSSSGSLQESLKELCESHKEDPGMCSILMLYATKPMQLAKYFSTGEIKNEEEWAHYALATPFYTHFTSPIRRYPDIVVHRTLLAAIEAADVLSATSDKEANTGDCGIVSASRCFTGLCLDKPKAASMEGQQALASAALKYKVPGNQDLALLAEHCNRRKLASRNVRDASDKLYLWAMLRKKNGIFSEARVLAVGPKFLSLYVYEIAMERRVYYDDTEGLGVEWFNVTATVILNLQHQKSSRKEKQGKGRALTDVAYLVNPANSSSIGEVAVDEPSVGQDAQLFNTDLCDGLVLELLTGSDADKKHEPAVLPLTLRLLDSVPVHVFALGGDNRPVDIGVRLYLTSYLQ